MLDLAPHDLSILLHWLGKPLVEVTANGRSVYQEGVHETAFLTLAFEGGAQANVQLSWLAPRKMRQMVVVGSKQMVQYEDTSADASVRIYDRGMDFSEPPANFGEYRLTYRTGDMVAPADRACRAPRPRAARTSRRRSSRGRRRCRARGSGWKWSSASRRSSALSNRAGNRSRSRPWSRSCGAAPPRRAAAVARHGAGAPPGSLSRAPQRPGLRRRVRRPRGSRARPGRPSPSARQWHRRRCRTSSPRAAATPRSRKSSVSSSSSSSIGRRGTQYRNLGDAPVPKIAEGGMVGRPD